MKINYKNMSKEIFIPETRGAKAKYDFAEMSVGETRTFENTTTGSLLNSAKAWCKRYGHSWEFRCYTVEGTVNIVRIK